MKNVRFFYLKNCYVLVVEFPVYLNRPVFVTVASNETFGSALFTKTPILVCRDERVKYP